MDHNFGPAIPDETVVYGASRLGYRHETSDPNAAVPGWIECMQSQGIERVCCLLDEKLRLYDDLLGQYETAFGQQQVCHGPIPDYSTVEQATWCEQIYPFLSMADTYDEPVIVHCSAGQGRTGHVLALWLRDGRGYDLETAVNTVQETGRTPLERKHIEDLAAI